MVMVFWFGQIGLPTKSSKTIDSWTGNCRSPAGLTGYRRNRGDLLLESVRQDHLAPEQSKRIGARPSLDFSRNSPHPVLLYYHQTYFRQHRRELTFGTKSEHYPQSIPEKRGEAVISYKRSEWLKKLDKECPFQLTLPRRKLTDNSGIMDFLLSYVGKFDMYVEDECAAYVRYCFAEPMDAAIFRSRFEAKSEPYRLAS
jgi:hypothetical protein